MNAVSPSILRQFPPMGIYEVLFSFLDASGTYMGEPGTHPWAQGFPLTTPLPGGPPIPSAIEFDSTDLKYPPATGIPELLAAIRDYYNHFYDAGITTDNIAVFAGGRPGIFASIAFLDPSLEILIEETEYTPYFDLLTLLDRSWTTIPSNRNNRFRPTLNEYRAVQGDRRDGFIIKSNPCNPTGVTRTGNALAELVQFCCNEGAGGLIDEAYEFFQSPEPDSALRYIDDINQTNLFISGAATKGLQAPGLRVGWIIAAEQNIEIFRNYSSIGMGGVARPSQMLVAQMLELERVDLARQSVGRFFGAQRERYAEALADLGIELFTGDGGFYHWGRLPAGLTARELNRRLFAHQAAILPGTLCDMQRRGDEGPHGDLFRFSFGPLHPSTFEENISILRHCLESE